MTELSDYLPQWQYYANNCIGYNFAITSDIIANFGKWKNEDDFRSIALVKVIYDETEFVNEIESLVESLFEVHHSSQLAGTEYGKEELRNALVTILKITSCMYKNDHHSHEKEWRLVLRRQRDSTHEFVKYRTRGPLIVPYIDIPMRMDRDTQLHLEIMRGPAQNNEMPTSSIDDLVKSFNYSLELSKSKISYRG